MAQCASQEIKNKTTEQIRKIRSRATNIKSIDKRGKNKMKLDKSKSEQMSLKLLFEAVNSVHRM